MSLQNSDHEPNHEPQEHGEEQDAPRQEEQKQASSTTSTKPRERTDDKPRQSLPRWKVLLHNDDVNDQVYVVQTLVMLTPLGKEASINRMLEAHRQGVSVLLTTHRERAELYVQQFASRKLTVTTEPE